jgi:8-hydroxy-5-deazaflavin:NADPH oxidoreductase
MKVGILGTGGVGRTLGSALIAKGNEVRLGSRTAGNAKAVEWAGKEGDGASEGTFADAAAFGDIVFNCTSGLASLAALDAAGSDTVDGKVLIDVANPLDFSHGMPPTLTVCNDDSLGEQIQRRFPATRVVKALNTLTAAVMVNPSLVPGDHMLFICGDDADAKSTVARHLADWFGWKRDNIFDLGGIEAARGTEMLMPFWIRAMGVLKSPFFNYRIVVGSPPA